MTNFTQAYEYVNGYDIDYITSSVMIEGGDQLMNIWNTGEIAWQ